MTLRDTVFFPHAVLPMYIFEPRYRQMLEDVLSGDRMFAVVRESAGPDEDDSGLEPMHRYATIGIVRASQKNPDGTSNLVLQGISRVMVLRSVAEEPYRRIEIEMLPSECDSGVEVYRTARQRVCRLLRSSWLSRADTNPEVLEFLENIDDPDAFLDLAIHSVCQCPDKRQDLLETTRLEDRYLKFRRYLHGRIHRQRLFCRLQGGLDDDEIGCN